MRGFVALIGAALAVTATASLGSAQAPSQPPRWSPLGPLACAAADQVSDFTVDIDDSNFHGMPSPEGAIHRFVSQTLSPGMAVAAIHFDRDDQAGGDAPGALFHASAEGRGPVARALASRVGSEWYVAHFSACYEYSNSGGPNQ